MNGSWGGNCPGVLTEDWKVDAGLPSYTARSTLPPGGITVSYSFGAGGGPPGLSVSGGRLVGVPTASGSWVLTLTASAGASYQVQNPARTCTVRVAAASLEGSCPGPFAFGTRVSAGLPSYRFPVGADPADHNARAERLYTDLITGMPGWPPGLTLSDPDTTPDHVNGNLMTAGVLSGVPTELGKWRLRIGFGPVGSAPVVSVDCTVVVHLAGTWNECAVSSPLWTPPRVGERMKYGLGLGSYSLESPLPDGYEIKFDYDPPGRYGRGPSLPEGLSWYPWNLQSKRSFSPGGVTRGTPTEAGTWLLTIRARLLRDETPVEGLLTNPDTACRLVIAPAPTTTTTTTTTTTVAKLPHRVECSGAFAPETFEEMADLVGWETGYAESYAPGAGGNPPWVGLLTPPTGEEKSYRLVAGNRRRYPGTPSPKVRTVWDGTVSAADLVVVDIDRDPGDGVAEGGCGWEVEAVISEMAEVLMWDADTPASGFAEFVPTRTGKRGVPRSSTSTDESDPPYLVAWWENLTDRQQDAVRKHAGTGRWKVRDECAITYGTESQCEWWTGPPWPGVYWWRVGVRIAADAGEKELLLVLYEDAWYVPGLITSGWSIHGTLPSGGG